jgi:hypothetical protein
MIKGAQKRMIVMKTSESEVFEEAYFVLRRECDRRGDDIVEEANRIIEKCDMKKIGNRRKGFFRILCSVGLFFCGCAVGGGLAVLIIF